MRFGHTNFPVGKTSRKHKNNAQNRSIQQFTGNRLADFQSNNPTIDALDFLHGLGDSFVSSDFST